MYHIKNDLRAQKSANTIYRSIRHILKHKSLNDITITDIKNECGVSRSSFYRNFDTILDPIIMKLDFFVNEYLQKSILEENHIKFFFTYWDKHSELITILSKQGYSQLIVDSFQRCLNITNEYLINVKVSIMSSLLTTWMKNNKSEAIDEMVLITTKIINSNDLLL